MPACVHSALATHGSRSPPNPSWSCPQRSRRCAPEGLLPPLRWGRARPCRAARPARQPARMAPLPGRGAARSPAPRRRIRRWLRRARSSRTSSTTTTTWSSPYDSDPRRPGRPDGGRLHPRAARAARAGAAVRRRGADPERGARRAGRQDGSRTSSRSASSARRSTRGCRAGCTPSSTAGRAGRRSSGSSSRSSSAARRTRSSWHMPGAYNVLASGSPEQIERYLKPALRGELHDAYAVTEAEAGSDPSRIATTARRDRRRLGDRRREVVRHLRRRGGRVHRDGERARRGRRERASCRRCSWSTARSTASRSSTSRPSPTPIRTGIRRSASAASRSARTR